MDGVFAFLGAIDIYREEMQLGIVRAELRSSRHAIREGIVLTNLIEGKVSLDPDIVIEAEGQGTKVKKELLFILKYAFQRIRGCL